MITITPDDLTYAVKRAREETKVNQPDKIATSAQQFLSWAYDWTVIDTPSIDAQLRIEINTQLRGS